MSIKKYIEFLKEADQAPAPPPPADIPDQAQSQPPAQPPAQAQPSGSTETPPQAQASGTTQGETTGEEKTGDLSNYSNEEITKFPDTVKKMVDLLKDMDKAGLVKVRNLIAEIKGIGDAKEEIGKL